MEIKTAAFLLGVVVLHQVSVLPEPFWAGIALLLAVVFAFLRRWIVVCVLAGALWAHAAAEWSLAARLNPELEGRDLVAEGRIDGLPQRSDRLVRFNFRIASVVGGTASEVPNKVRLSWYNSNTVLRAGQLWHLKIRLKRPHGTFNPGGFDYESWLFLNGIGATGYVRSGNENRMVSAESGGSWIDELRHNLDEALNGAVADGETRAMLKALTIGVRHEIGRDQWDVLRRTGIAHLVAISGLHIGLIAGLTYFLVSRLWARAGMLAVSPPEVAAVVSLVTALFYAALADFSVPTQRALVMVMIVMTGLVLQRNLVPRRVLALALIAVVGYQPCAVTSAGFWLSFGAVAAIVYAVAGRCGKFGYWAGILRIHWVVFFALAPLLVLFFQQISIIAPFANAVAVPVVSLIVVPLCLSGALTILVWPAAGKLIFACAAAVVAPLWGVMEWLAALPFAQVVASKPPLWTIVSAVLGGVVLLTPRGCPGRWVALVLLLPAFLPGPKVPRDGAFSLTVLDVGQGLATVIQTARHVLVFDTGARFSDQFDMGSAVVGPFLRAEGISRIDTLLVSHGDNDHIGGAESLLRAFPVTRTYSSAPDALEYPAVTTCLSGQGWRWDEVVFEILSPPLASGFGENDRSCVLRVSAKHGSVLLSGDIERRAETWLVGRYGNALASDVLVVPHHGSDTSSTVAFVEVVRPRFAVIPAGYRNRFGFPKRVVVARYRNVDSAVVSTGDTGAIRIDVGDDPPLRLHAYRRSNGKFWNAGSD